MLNFMIAWLIPGIALIFTGITYYWMIRSKYYRGIAILYSLGMLLISLISCGQFSLIPDIDIRFIGLVFIATFYPMLMFFIVKEYYNLFVRNE